jgi:hypothetical protein
MSYIDITPSLMSDVARLKPSERRKVLRVLGKQEYDRCADDLHYWLDSTQHLVPYVYTRDEKPLYQCHICMKEGDNNPHLFHNLKQHLKIRHNIDVTDSRQTRGYFVELPTIRPFPYYLPYIKPIAETWLTEQIVCIPKSRDMVATWQVVAYYTWDTYFHPGRQNFFQSEKAGKAKALVRRAEFIIKQMPEFLRLHKAVFGVGEANSGQLIIPAVESEIIGLPQGPDQIRMHHPSGVYLDEAAFQQLAGETFAAIKPAIQAGGRMTLVSSANPGFFQLACEDKLDEESSS